MAQLDHLVVTVPRLADGVAWVERLLGVPMAGGGQHARMGTHNRLLRLDGTAYLEVIAIDPDAAAPPHPRWFGLDALAPDAPPRLAAWVARSDAIDAEAAACALDLGAVQPMSRGEWHWRITVPASGMAPLDGVAPALIAWPSGAHPAQRLPDEGVSLQALWLHHGDGRAAAALLAALGHPAPVHAAPAADGQARLSARLQVSGRELVLGG